jgi:hypothetical protein
MSITPKITLAARKPVDRLLPELVADPQQRVDRVVAAGRLAADQQAGRPELGFGVVDQPAGHRQAVVGALGEGVLRRQPVVDGHDRDAVLLHVGDVAGVVELGAADHHPAPVEVEVDRGGRAVGAEGAAGHAGDVLVDAPGIGDLDGGDGLAQEVDPALGVGVAVRRLALEDVGERLAHLAGLGPEVLVLVGPELHHELPCAGAAGTVGVGPAGPVWAAGTGLGTCERSLCARLRRSRASARPDQPSSGRGGWVNWVYRTLRGRSVGAVASWSGAAQVHGQVARARWAAARPAGSRSRRTPVAGTLARWDPATTRSWPLVGPPPVTATPTVTVQHL